MGFRFPYMLFVSLGLLYITKTYLDFENPIHLWTVRGVYLFSQLMSWAVLGYIYFRALNEKTEGLVAMKEDLGFGQEGEKVMKVSIGEHDIMETRKQATRLGMGFLITAFLHLRWGFTPPLVLQSLMQPFNLYNTPLVKVTVRGFRAWGELKRPWKEPLNDMTKRFQQFTETFDSAMSGEPATKKSKKEKKKRK